MKRGVKMLTTTVAVSYQAAETISMVLNRMGTRDGVAALGLVEVVDWARHNDAEVLVSLSAPGPVPRGVRAALARFNRAALAAERETP